MQRYASMKIRKAGSPSTALTINDIGLGDCFRPIERILYDDFRWQEDAVFMKIWARPEVKAADEAAAVNLASGKTFTFKITRTIAKVNMEARET
jgi:hypothetical protein